MKMNNEPDFKRWKHDLYEGDDESAYLVYKACIKDFRDGEFEWVWCSKRDCKRLAVITVRGKDYCKFHTPA